MDDTDPQAESDLRRRAAWLLGMLVIVAVLLVIVLNAVLGSGGHGGNANGPAPLDTAASRHGSQGGSSPASRSRAAATSSARATAHASASCPTSQRCALDTDIGGAVAAVNAYRAQHGQASVPGTVSEPAKQCALNNGSGCSGSWAESQVPGPDGAAAVRKIAGIGKLLDPQLKSFGVGWAYDPQTKAYFFAIVRDD